MAASNHQSRSAGNQMTTVAQFDKCPWCGGQDDQITIRNDYEAGVQVVDIFCRDCGRMLTRHTDELEFELTLAAPVPDKVCYARCNKAIAENKAFCDEHWALLPRSLQEQIAFGTEGAMDKARQVISVLLGE